MRNIHRPERSATAVREVEVKERAHKLRGLYPGLVRGSRFGQPVLAMVLRATL